MRNFIITDGDYIVATAETSFGHDANAEAVEQMLCHQPTAQNGYVYKMRADTLEWELVELPPAPPPSPDDELTDTEALSLITGGTT